MRLIYLSVLLGVSLAAPMHKGEDSLTLAFRRSDADDLVHNSWSARAIIPENDADDLVKNSWSARAVVPKGAEHGAAGVLPRDDADDLVRNSWSARA